MDLQLDLNAEISQASQFEDLYRQLVILGFGEEDATLAAIIGRGDLNAAIEYLVVADPIRNDVKSHIFVRQDMGNCAICMQSEQQHTNIVFEQKEEEAKVKGNNEFFIRA
jgi:hypothetical protein